MSIYEKEKSRIHLFNTIFLKKNIYYFLLFGYFNKNYLKIWLLSVYM
jgi:hypothetical protein